MAEKDKKKVQPEPEPEKEEKEQPEEGIKPPLKIIDRFEFVDDMLKHIWDQIRKERNNSIRASDRGARDINDISERIKFARTDLKLGKELYIKWQKEKPENK